MSGFTTATWQQVIDDQFATAVRTAPTGPPKLALETVAGTATAAGTELTGYTRPACAMAAAVAGPPVSASNSGALSIPCSTGATVNALALYDSAGTPVRKAWGGLTTPRTVVAGDSLAFAAGAIVFQGTS